MRARLTAAFVVVSLVLLMLALGIRTMTTADQLRRHESRDLDREVAQVAASIELREALVGPVDELFLEDLIDSDERLVYVAPDGTETIAEGQDYSERNAEDAISASTSTEAAGSVVLRQSGSVVEDLADASLNSLGLLIVFVGLLAALGGYVIARLVSRPFRQLAVAAEQLGRGRFDLDLPRTRIPEARAISQSLLGSAAQLQERLASDQTFAEHTSHVLRSPLTGLRLELEDLALREDVPEDVRATADRSVNRIESIDIVAGDLVDLARRGPLVTGAVVSLRELATQCAQVWANALAVQERELTAAVEGRIETTYTPGPVEHILDLLLAEVLARGTGSVRMVFEADDEGHLRIHLSGAGLREPGDHGGAGATAGQPLAQAGGLVTALGGRLGGEDPRHLTILLPRR